MSENVNPNCYNQSEPQSNPQPVKAIRKIIRRVVPPSNISSDAQPTATTVLDHDRDVDQDRNRPNGQQIQLEQPISTSEQPTKVRRVVKIVRKAVDIQQGMGDGKSQSTPQDEQQNAQNNTQNNTQHNTPHNTQNSQNTQDNPSKDMKNGENVLEAQDGSNEPSSVQKPAKKLPKPRAQRAKKAQSVDNDALTDDLVQNDGDGEVFEAVKKRGKKKDDGVEKVKKTKAKVVKKGTAAISVIPRHTHGQTLLKVIDYDQSKAIFENCFRNNNLIKVSQMNNITSQNINSKSTTPIDNSSLSARYTANTTKNTVPTPKVGLYSRKKQKTNPTIPFPEQGSSLAKRIAPHRAPTDSQAAYGDYFEEGFDDHKVDPQFTSFLKDSDHVRLNSFNNLCLELKKVVNIVKTDKIKVKEEEGKGGIGKSIAIRRGGQNMLANRQNSQNVLKNQQNMIKMFNLLLRLHPTTRFVLNQSGNMVLNQWDELGSGKQKRSANSNQNTVLSSWPKSWNNIPKLIQSGDNQTGILAVSPDSWISCRNIPLYDHNNDKNSGKYLLRGENLVKSGDEITGSKDPVKIYQRVHNTPIIPIQHYTYHWYHRLETLLQLKHDLTMIEKNHKNTEKNIEHHNIPPSSFANHKNISHSAGIFPQLKGHIDPFGVDFGVDNEQSAEKNTKTQPNSAITTSPVPPFLSEISKSLLQSRSLPIYPSCMEQVLFTKILYEIEMIQKYGFFSEKESSLKILKNVQKLPQTEMLLRSTCDGCVDLHTLRVKINQTGQNYPFPSPSCTCSNEKRMVFVSQLDAIIAAIRRGVYDSYMELLHEYNEKKEISSNLMQKLASFQGKTIQEVYNTYISKELAQREVSERGN